MNIVHTTNATSNRTHRKCEMKIMHINIVNCINEYKSLTTYCNNAHKSYHLYFLHKKLNSSLTGFIEALLPRGLVV